MTVIAMPAAPTAVEGSWVQHGNCTSVAPDELFVRGARQQQAKLICKKCPVLQACLADALDQRMEFGVWGGMTERERRVLLKQNPHIRSWKALFEDARAESA